MPWVSTYTYVGVTLHQRLSWAHHVDALLRRGERKMAACVSWTNAANLPLCFVERIFKNYVCPSACFGLEFVPAGPQLRRFQTRFLQWGRRLLTWPRGSPGVVVQGQLGWHDVVTVHLTQAAGLCARLLSLPPHCCAVRIAQYACTQSQSWIQSVLDELRNHGVPHPHDAGIHMGCPSPSLRRWLRDVKFALGSHADARYATTLSACNSLRTYACWQPCP